MSTARRAARFSAPDLKPTPSPADFQELIRAAALEALARMHDLSHCDDPAVAAEARQLLARARQRILRMVTPDPNALAILAHLDVVPALPPSEDINIRCR